jgi:uncharacterized membrane protein
MDRMLVVVFDNEAKAYEGRKALRDLDRQGDVAVYAAAVLAKRADGTTFVREGDDLGIVGGVVGTSLGTLIGMLGGPAGMAIGATAGWALGAGVDLDHARISEDFIDDVTKQLSSGKAVVVAEVEEDWTAPVDTVMESLGGTIFRRALSEVRHTVNQEAIAAMKADLAQLKAEHAQASADRKAKLAAGISQLESRIQAQMQKAKERREAALREQQSKTETLRAKAAAAKAAVSR